MSFEQDLIDVSYILNKARESGLECTEGQFENGERIIQQKGLNNVLRYWAIEIKNIRLKEENKALKEEIHELKQARPASTTLPEE